MDNKLKTVDAETLLSTPMSKTMFIVDGLISQGVNVISGASKIGKSWLMLWLGLQVAQGNSIWGLPTLQCDVLYLSLEDTQRRIKDRLYNLTDSAPDNLYFAVTSGLIGGGLEEQITDFLTLAADLKAKKKAGIPHRLCEGKQAALIFEKTSTRTRCSFEVAAHDLGMTVTYLDPSGSQIGKKESIADTAEVLSGMFDGIEYRGYGQQIVEDLARYAGVPVWNGLTNEFHPTQILADFLTIREHFGKLKGIHFVYFGDARYNMGNSLMVGCAKMGLNFTACAPRKYQPDAALVEQCLSLIHI